MLAHSSLRDAQSPASPRSLLAGDWPATAAVDHNPVIHTQGRSQDPSCKVTCRSERRSSNPSALPYKWVFPAVPFDFQSGSDRATQGGVAGVDGRGKEGVTTHALPVRAAVHGLHLPHFPPHLRPWGRRGRGPRVRGRGS